MAMTCSSCGSMKTTEFTSEINVHFRGLENIDNPGVLVLAKLLVCLDCGFSQFLLTEIQLSLLEKGTPTSLPTIARKSGDRGILRRQDCA